MSGPVAGQPAQTWAGVVVRNLSALLPRRSDWTISSPGRDLLAGLMVGLVALPLALGFGVASGLGAGAGIVTAVVAGAVAAVFGGSRVQVSGPTGAMTVVLVPIVAAYGAEGVLVVGLMAGLMLLALSVARAGRFIRYLPVPVVEGFTAGIAVIIALQQVPSALGVDVRAESVLTLVVRAVRAWAADVELTALGITLAVVVAVLVLARWRPRLPGTLLAVVVATVASQLLGWNAATIGELPSGIPVPAWPDVPWGGLGALVLPAVAVAALAALESLLSATVADGMSVGQRHDPDRELFGQGLANLAAPLFGGIPATAAIARTAVNARSGATSRLAALTHAIALLLVILLASTWVSQIPLAALAGVLIATAIQMVKVSSIRSLMRSTRGDAVVLVLTAGATVVFDLVTAVLLGLSTAGLLALRQTARASRLEQQPVDDSDHTGEERSVLDEHIVVYRIEGALFFAAAHDFLLELTQVSRVRVVVLRMSRVTSIDATGATVLADTITDLEHRGVTVMLSGVQPRHEQVLRELGVYEHLAHERHVFGTTPDAIAHARAHVARTDHPDRVTSLDEAT